MSESYESKGGDIKIFFIGQIYGYGGLYTTVKAFLVHFGIYVEVSQQFIHVEGNNFFPVDGKIKHLETPCTITLHNFSGFGTPLSILMVILKSIIIPNGVSAFFAGSCESYEIQNETVMAT
ncbi:MAG: hypothetical protein JXA91_05835 [Candidatus Thermoplasmatota archaeon]|nr:hypothetical protein [Candidatus Thermoplasmatota archaeon]